MEAAMGVNIQISNVELIEKNMWLSKLEPREVAMLGENGPRVGEYSIILAMNPQHDAKQRTLTVQPHKAFVLNVGSTDQAVIVACKGKTDTAPTAQSVLSAQHELLGAGDGVYLRALERLSPPMQQAGLQLLQKVRTQYAGRLVQKGRRFIDYPDNFWTISVQPYKDALFITLRGRPEHFEKVANKIVIKEDRTGYSSFKLLRPSDIEEASLLILAAKRR
jgi:hypothetical protein